MPGAPGLRGHVGGVARESWGRKAQNRGIHWYTVEIYRNM